ncbi:MAG: hypothetical protein BWY96_00719 [Spirochaetes bacterium ADurb.BinA120]|nr:MAG: hypothetical protein BWY96_00719 [Spirochaetes bacterium ADurb.BinA120]
MMKTILIIIGMSCWLFVLVTSSIRLVNSQLDKSIEQKLKSINN